MFTLKLYQNGQGMAGSRCVVMEVAGIWSDHCDGDVKHVQAFQKTVGVQDEDGPKDFYVGGQPTKKQTEPVPSDLGQQGIAATPAITLGVGGNWYGWGVLENAQGKTTEVFR